MSKNNRKFSIKKQLLNQSIKILNSDTLFLKIKGIHTLLNSACKYFLTTMINKKILTFFIKKKRLPRKPYSAYRMTKSNLNKRFN